MKTILINQSTNQPTSKVFDDGYKVDGQRVSAENLAKQGLVEMEYIDTPHPELTTTQTATSQWQVTENGYERVWSVREKTALELALEDWDAHEFSKRITAPAELGESYPEIVSYAFTNPKKLKIIPTEGSVRVYYNTLKDNHDDLVKHLGLDKTEEPRPC